MHVTFGTDKKAEKKPEDDRMTVMVVSTAMIFSAGFLCGKHHAMATMRAQSEILRNVAQAVR